MNCVECVIRFDQYPSTQFPNVALYPVASSSFQVKNNGGTFYHLATHSTLSAEGYPW